MNFSKILGSISPRVSARILSFVLAIFISFASIKVYGTFIKDIPEEEDNGDDLEEQLQSEHEAEKQEERKDFNTDTAFAVGTVVNGTGAILCNLTDGTAIAEKNAFGKTAVKDAASFMVALVVSKAVTEGRIALTDEAVCPASAAKCRYYELSEDIMPIGKRMRIADIVKCMLYQNGSAYAYTLAVHISGSEEAFVEEMNGYAKELGLRETFFADSYGDEAKGSSVSPYDLAVIVKYFLSDPMLKSMFCSDDMITVGYGQSGSITLAVKNDFFLSYCTESQAKADGIIGGKVSGITHSGWACVLFNKEGKEYLSLVLESKEPFVDCLMLYTAYVLSVE